MEKTIKVQPRGGIVLEKTIKVQGMSCGHCRMAVAQALQRLEGVDSVEVDLQTGNVSITYTEAEVGLAQFVQAVTDAGYQVVE